MPQNDPNYRRHVDDPYGRCLTTGRTYNCESCQDSGMVADTDDREPWPMWRDLPKGARFAVDVGLVRPIPCPDCSGDPGKLDGDIELLKQSLVQLYPLINRVADKTPVANKTNSNETVRMIRLLREICYLIHKDG